MKNKINIQEDYVSFEVAKLLKEKGFDEQCGCLHIQGEKSNISIDIFASAYGRKLCTNSQIEEDREEKEFTDYLKNKEVVTSPTQALVLKWLRVTHNFHISVDADCKFEIERVKEGKYGGHIVIGETFWDTSSTEYDSCEAATEAAILYVIKNLLK